MTLIEKKIKGNAFLEENWSSFNSPRPSEKAINLALKSLGKLSEWYIIPDNIAPTLDGGIKFTFFHGSKSFELEFFNDGDIVFVNSTKDGHEDIIDITYEQLKELLRNLEIWNTKLNL